MILPKVRVHSFRTRQAGLHKKLAISFFDIIFASIDQTKMSDFLTPDHLIQFSVNSRLILFVHELVKERGEKRVYMLADLFPLHDGDCTVCCACARRLLNHTSGNDASCPAWRLSCHLASKTVWWRPHSSATADILSQAEVKNRPMLGKGVGERRLHSVITSRWSRAL